MREQKAVVGSLLLGLYDEDGQLDHVGFTSAIPAAERTGLSEGAGGLVESAGLHRQRAWRAEPLEHRAVDGVGAAKAGAGGRGALRPGHRWPLPPRHGVPRWRPDKAPKQCTFDQLAPELRPSELKELFYPLSLLLDTPLIEGLRYEEDGDRRGRGARAYCPLGEPGACAVPIPRMGRQPADAELRLALRLRGRELRSGRADPRLARALSENAPLRSAALRPTISSMRCSPVTTPAPASDGIAIATSSRRSSVSRSVLRRRSASGNGWPAGSDRANSRSRRAPHICSRARRGTIGSTASHPAMRSASLSPSVRCRRKGGQIAASRLDRNRCVTGTVLRPCAWAHSVCCSRSRLVRKGREADLPSIGEARSLAAEWALVNDLGEPGQAHADVRADDAQERCASSFKRHRQSLTQRDSALRDGNRRRPAGNRTTPAPKGLRTHAAKLKRFEDSLKSA